MIHLVDASVYVFRAYYSMPPDMRDGDGNPVHALYGFARFLGDLIERASPEYMAVAFDASLATSFRNLHLSGLQGQPRARAAGPACCSSSAAASSATSLGVAWFDSEEFEADDIIGTLAHAHAQPKGLRVDHRLARQGPGAAHRPGRRVLGLRRRPALTSHGEIEERFGVMPDRYADYLALTGDAVDNIPGVPGVGPEDGHGVDAGISRRWKTCTNGWTPCATCRCAAPRNWSDRLRAASRGRLPRARADAHPLRHAR